MDKKHRLPDGGQATEEVKVQQCGDKSAGDRGRHTAGGRSLMPCRRVGQRTLARTASAATEIQNERSGQHPVQKHNRVFLQIIFRAEVPWKRLANLLFTTDE